MQTTFSLDNPFDTTTTIGILNTASNSSSSIYNPSLMENTLACTYPSYPFWTFTYPSVTYAPNSVQVKKAENGYIVEYSSKTWIARNENDVAKIISNQFKDKKQK